MADSNHNRGAHHRDLAMLRQQSAVARARCDALESAVAATARRWKAEGLATVRKAYARSRTDGGYGVGGDAPVDFTGTLASGQKIAFDCKSIERAATYRHDPNRQHQLVFLKRIRKQGGLAFLLLYDAELGVAFLCRDLDALAKGAAVPVRQLHVGRATFTALLPTTPVTLDAADRPVFLPQLLADAQHHCAPDEVVQG